MLLVARSVHAAETLVLEPALDRWTSVGQLGRGSYDVALDSSHTSRLISQQALDDGILPFLKRRRL